MRRFLHILSGFCLLGCQSFGGETASSSWYALKKASKVPCEVWPLRERDLQIDEINLVHSTNPGFLISGLQRDATPLNYFAPFDGLDILPSKFSTLSLGRGAVIVGSGQIAGTNVAVVIHNYAAKAAVELRTVPGNIVKFQSDLGPFNVVDGTAAISKGGIWIAYKSEANVQNILYLDTHDPKKIKNVPFKGLNPTNAPTFLTNRNKPDALLVWKDGESGRPFRAQNLHDSGQADPAVTLDTQVDQLESWTATAVDEAVYLASIDGDTMIGQATLKVSAFYPMNSGLRLKWTKAMQLTDTHATDPIFMTSSKGLEVLLLNWIDEESTIARYLVTASNVAKPSYSGVFQKGTRIMEAFTGGDADSFILTRHREGTRWTFELCDLKE